MTIDDDLRAAFRAIEAEPPFSRMATVHHPNCPCVTPVCITASWPRPPTIADCTCGGAAFPMRADTLAR